MIVMSPSNILAHMKCPLQAWAMREKYIVWKDSPQKQRGTDVHAALEQSVKDGFKVPVLPEGCDMLYVTDLMNKLKLVSSEHKLTVLAEQDLAVTSKFKPTQFFADDAFFRCRADLLMIGKSFAIIGDWKTGKIYDYSKNQMRLEALLVACVYNIRIIHYDLFYLDQGQTVKGTVDLSSGFSSLDDLFDVMKEMQSLSKTNGPWPARKNTFCRWCDWYHKDCTESAKW